MTDQQFKQSAMIALLPVTTDWCRIELPHLTLVYAGEIDKLKLTDFNELAKDASTIAMLARPLTLEVLGLEVFGNWTDDPDDKVDVYRLRPTSELLSMRRTVERWNKSEFPFNPHVTIGPTGQFNQYPAPRLLAFDRVLVGWGNEYLTFRMNR
jgi:2'-5' RNA ligase